MGRADRRVRLARARLYLIVTVPAPDWEARVEDALQSDCIDLVQLRDTSGDEDAVGERAVCLQRLCRARDALFLVNDRPRLAAELGADGAHVGQDDLPAAAARALLGPHALLGLSTHDEAEVEAARRGPVDYVGLGPCFATRSKALERAPGGAGLVRRCLPAAGALPLFPIGGITPENAHSLASAGASRLAVGAGILAAAHPAEAARRLAALLRAPAGGAPRA